MKFSFFVMLCYICSHCLLVYNIYCLRVLINNSNVVFKKIIGAPGFPKHVLNKRRRLKLSQRIASLRKLLLVEFSNTASTLCREQGKRGWKIFKRISCNYLSFNKWKEYGSACFFVHNTKVKISHKREGAFG